MAWIFTGGLHPLFDHGQRLPDPLFGRLVEKLADSSPVGAHVLGNGVQGQTLIVEPDGPRDHQTSVYDRLLGSVNDLLQVYCKDL